MENDEMLSRFAVLILTMTTACAAAPSRVARPWHVSLETSGGFTGRGLGNLSLDSDGNLEVTTMTRKTCSMHVTAEELRDVETLLAASHPEKWGSYFPENRCCDRVEYKLTYDNHSAEWIDSPPPMPADLVDLDRALADLRSKYQKECIESEK
jgi:hypothetical protein